MDPQNVNMLNTGLMYTDFVYFRVHSLELCLQEKCSYNCPLPLIEEDKLPMEVFFFGLLGPILQRVDINLNEVHVHKR